MLFRETTNEKYPINAAFRQPKDKAIEIFLKLFGNHKEAVFQEMLRLETDVRKLIKQNELYIENSIKFLFVFNKHLESKYNFIKSVLICHLVR